MNRIILLVAFLISVTNLFAQTTMPHFFSDSMILQQQTLAAIWGQDKPNTTVTVKASWGKTATTLVTNNGKWRLKIETPKAGGPFTLIIKGTTTLTFKNVLVGEVWLCSGQSNMEMPVKGYNNQPITGSNNTILHSTNPNIRVFHTPKAASKTPLDNVMSYWKQASPENTGNFSATAYFFAQKIQSVLGVPVGIIQCSWGASTIESWMDSTTLASFKNFTIPDSVTLKNANTSNTMLYRSMMHPYIGYTIKGMLWYQGEANRNNAKEYPQLCSLMVQSYRRQWQQGNFPFYFVQIAPFGSNEKDMNNALVREAQLKCMQIIENSGMAVTLDIGEKDVIHPSQKQEVGNRLAYWAFAKDYGIKGIAFSGPVYKSTEKTANDSLIVSFNYAEMGLTTFGKPLTEFEIAGEDKIFYPANAIISKNKNASIVVWNDKVKNPVSVRYAFKNWVQGSLYNIQGLPASSFRTDDW